MHMKNLLVFSADARLSRLEGEAERLYYIHKIFLRDEGKLCLMNIQCAVMGRSLVRNTWENLPDKPCILYVMNCYETGVN